jgi:hypothetical protein
MGKIDALPFYGFSRSIIPEMALIEINSEKMENPAHQPTACDGVTFPFAPIYAAKKRYSSSAVN